MGRKSYLQERTSNPRVTNDIRGDEDGVSSCLGCGWAMGWGGVGMGWGGVGWRWDGMGCCGVGCGWDGMGWGGVGCGWDGVGCGRVWVGWDGMGWGGVAVGVGWCDTIPTIPYHTGVACFLQLRCVEKPRPQPDVAV